MIQATGAQIIVKLLERQDVQFVAGIPGNSVLPLYDELQKSSIRHILVRHEQGGGFLAEGIARTTGKPGVCIATSGPGATNLLTAIADARSDSIPLVAITGQVNICQIGTDAFQEVDTFGLSMPITKHSVMVKSAAELLTVIPEAFSLSCSGRPGPVLIDIPRDVQLQVVQFDQWPEPGKRLRRSARFCSRLNSYPKIAESFCSVLLSARKPVLFLGGGCNTPEASSGIAQFLNVFPIPVVTSLMGIGSVSCENKLLVGMVGRYGFPQANQAIHDADVILAAGVRFDDRATGSPENFCPNAKILHIDIDEAEVNKILPASFSFVADAESVFPLLTEVLRSKLSNESPIPASARARWIKNTTSVKTPAATMCGAAASFIASIPSLALKQGLKSDDLIVVTDVGLHQMWTAQNFCITRPRQFLTSGSLGAMGFALPTAIGASIANPEKKVVCFSGDGSILMNIQELATLAELEANVTIIVFENNSLGMIREQQDASFGGRHFACDFEKMPDIIAVAKGFGINACDTSDADWESLAFSNRQPCLVRYRMNEK